MTPRQLVSQLGALRFEDAFNPYSDRCSICDRDDAPLMRSQMLEATLTSAASVEVDAIWVGRDLGHRGGRRTGLAFTDDTHLEAHLSRWGISGTRPTKDSAVSEKTAKVIWSKLTEIRQPIFLWNVFPLHPHETGKPLSNRMHKASEGRAGMDILTELVALLRPKRLVAVGNDAEKAIQRLSHKGAILKVRHPSYGGQTEFRKQVQDLYGIVPAQLL